ncbi:Nesprin-2 [Manis pentadactyla]|nr:Nesprin-2 [Manis pentadactyla]
MDRWFARSHSSEVADPAQFSHHVAAELEGAWSSPPIPDSSCSPLPSPVIALIDTTRFFWEEKKASSRPPSGSECWGPKFAILDPENESMAGPGGLQAFELAVATYAFMWSLGLEDTGVSSEKTAEKIA